MKKNKIKCNGCLKEKTDNISELCKECSNKMDEHLIGDDLE